MAWDAADGYVVLFGGLSGSGALESDTWTYLNGTWTNITSSVTGRPPPTAEASMAFDPSTHSVIMFGGTDLGVGVENYTWSYHSRSWTNLTTTAGGPPATSLSSMSADPSDGELVAVVETPVFQTWTFQGGHWTNLTSSAPPPLQTSYADLPFGLGSDPTDGGVLLLSEYFTASSVYGATYLFKAGAWQNLTAQAGNAPIYSYGIVPWTFAPLAYLPSASAVLFYATISMTRTEGYYEVPETWLFSSGHWTNISGPAGEGPGPWFGGATAGAVDPADSAFVTFGGVAVVGSSTFWLPTWVLSAPPLVTASVAPATTDVGMGVHLTGNVSFGLEPNNGTWSFGDASIGIGTTTTHTYTRAGLYEANFTVTDLIGQSAAGAAALAVNARPVPTFSLVPALPAAGGNVTFVATVSGGTPPFVLGWDLGDGTPTGLGSVITHVYASKGTYLVNLSVTDSAGAVASSNMTVTVASAPASTPPGSSSNTPIDLTSGLGFALLLLVIALVVVAAVLGVLLVLRGRKVRPPPTAYPPLGAGGPGAPPTGGGSP
jgi:hypothetical protein